ncbi:F-box domain [Arabidopsis thaliana x Arabidopsis arenosa]|uniref:F-box domain n=1 Tax=Arabidopsis thaliana x Arabidopsis arenosa TaxID=1240361 RepID=A0A8T1Y2X0_9BRAS|nr:F-box domain [Arabidopsis thaliana x Arabidopsis arenosa]
MDIISQCPDHLLLRILSSIPTKDVIVTSLLSKRWVSLWRWVPKLEYDFTSQNIRFIKFVYRSLLQNKAPVLERLHLKNLSLNPECRAVDIGGWIDIAVSRRVRELEISINYSDERFRLPSSLYTCETLESFTLTIKNCVVVDAPLAVCIPSLKKLHLRCIGWADPASLLRLISGCTNLEELRLARPDDDGDYIMIHKAGHTIDYTVDVPSFKRRKIFESLFDHMFGKGSSNVINAPLQHFSISNDYYIYNILGNDKMPDLDVLRMAVTIGTTYTFLKDHTRFRSLYLCLSLSVIEVTNPHGSIYGNLVDLKICTCTQGWWDLLTIMLQSSPKLRFLTLTNEHCHGFASLETPPYWKGPSTVPACLLSSLQGFKWSGYNGRQGDKEVATYVLRNATGLKKMIFSSQTFDFREKFRMLQELASVPTPSPSCRLLFDRTF